MVWRYRPSYERRTDTGYFLRLFRCLSTIFQPHTGPVVIRDRWVIMHDVSGNIPFPGLICLLLIPFTGRPFTARRIHAALFDTCKYGTHIIVRRGPGFEIIVN